MDFAPTSNERVDIIDSGSAIAIAGGGNSARPTVEVRGYKSYYLSVSASVTGAPAAFDPLGMSIIWQDVNGTIVYKDTAEIWANAAAPFAVAFNRFLMQDQMHGPFMFVTFVNNSGDPMTVTYELVGSTRVLTGPFAHHESKNQDGIVVSSTAALAAATTTLPGGYGYGRAWIRLANAGANPMTLSVQFGSGTGALGLTGAAAGTTTFQEIVVPKRAPRFTVGGTIGDTYNLFVAQQLVAQ